MTSHLLHNEALMVHGIYNVMKYFYDTVLTTVCKLQCNQLNQNSLEGCVGVVGQLTVFAKHMMS